MAVFFSPGTRLSDQKVLDVAGDGILIPGKSIRVVTEERFSEIGGEGVSSEEFFLGETRLGGYDVPVKRQRFGRGNRKTWTSVAEGVAYR